MPTTLYHLSVLIGSSFSGFRVYELPKLCYRSSFQLEMPRISACNSMSNGLSLDQVSIWPQLGAPYTCVNIFRMQPSKKPMQRQLTHGILTKKQAQITVQGEHMKTKSPSNVQVMNCHSQNTVPMPKPSHTRNMKEIIWFK